MAIDYDKIFSVSTFLFWISWAFVCHFINSVRVHREKWKLSSMGFQDHLLNFSVLTLSRWSCFSMSRFCSFLSLHRLFWNQTRITIKMANERRLLLLNARLALNKFLNLEPTQNSISVFVYNFVLNLSRYLTMYLCYIVTRFSFNFFDDKNQ